MLRDRLHASLRTVHALPEVDAARTAANGYCFGGKGVIDSQDWAGRDGRRQRSRNFGAPGYDNVTPIAARLLICNGWEDPLAPSASVVALGEELTTGGADW